MFPTILELGPLTVRSYGVLLAVSFVVGIVFAARRARSGGLDPDLIYSVAWLLVASGIVGARILYVLQHTGEFAGRPLDALKLWQGGLTLYGGVVLASVVTMLHLRRRTDRPFAYLDALAPFLALGEGITRVGCFLNGCCFGAACRLPWAVTYPPEAFASEFHGHPHAIHPSQLYQSALGFVAFGFLSWLFGRRRFDGQVFFVLLVLEGVFRFVTDYARYYEPEQRSEFLGVVVTQSQLFGAAFVLVGIAGYAMRAWSARRGLGGVADGRR